MVGQQSRAIHISGEFKQYDFSKDGRNAIFVFRL